MHEVLARPQSLAIPVYVISAECASCVFWTEFSGSASLCVIIYSRTPNYSIEPPANRARVAVSRGGGQDVFHTRTRRPDVALAPVPFQSRSRSDYRRDESSSYLYACT